VFCTPENAYLLLAESKIKIARRFLETRVAGQTKLHDDAVGQEISMQSRHGFSLRDPATLPADSWYRTFLERLKLLAERRSPALDLLAFLYTDRDESVGASPWREVVGLLMRDAENGGVTGDDLRGRLGLWATAKRDKFRKDRRIHPLLIRTATPPA